MKDMGEFKLYFGILCLLGCCSIGYGIYQIHLLEVDKSYKLISFITSILSIVCIWVSYSLIYIFIHNINYLNKIKKSDEEKIKKYKKEIGGKIRKRVKGEKISVSERTKKRIEEDRRNRRR